MVDAEILRGVIVIFILFLLIIWVTRDSRDPPPRLLRLAWMGRLSAAAIYLTLELTRIYTSEAVYRYHPIGSEIAYAWRHLQATDVPFNLGTQFITYFTGALYTLVGPSVYSGFALYATFGFFGSFLFYRAFRLAFPQGNKRRYGYLILFYPSFLFWTSNLGKDSLIFLCLGAIAYGGARLLKHGPQIVNLSILLVGLGGTVLIRPHVGVIVAFPLLVFSAWQLSGKWIKKPVARLGVLALAAIIVIGLLTLTLKALHIELSLTKLLSEMKWWAIGTSYGGSSFTPPDITKPEGILLAFPSVLFRPYLWEIHNLPALFASLESIFLLMLLLWHRRSIRAAFHDPFNIYVGFLLGYSVLSIVALNTLGNLGLLARQRTMLLPFLLMLTCLLEEGWFSKQSSVIIVGQ
jgi:hypothetical protein